MAVAVWYTEASELMPSLRSYWLVIHVTVATLATAVFTIGAAAQRGLPAQGRVRAVRPGQRPRPLPRDPRDRAHRLQPAHRRVPAVDLHPHRRRHLGAPGLGVLLELGPQGGLDLRHLGRLRGIPALPGDQRDQPPDRDLHRARGLRLHHRQLRRRERVLRRPALLLGAVDAALLRPAAAHLLRGAVAALAGSGCATRTSSGCCSSSAR